MKDNASVLMKSTTNVAFRVDNCKSAFSLPEAIISITVIGIIAVLTIPSIVNDWKDVRYATAYNKMNATIANGFGLMIAEGNISGYNSTEDFVQNMERYFNISSVCPNNDLSECFSSQISTIDGIIKLSDIKKASNLGQVWSTDTNVNGVVFSDGTSMLIAYNRDGCSSYADGRDAILASCVAIAYDLDGANNFGNYVQHNNNKDEKGIRDIGLINATFIPNNENFLASSAGYDESLSSQNTQEYGSATDDENENEATTTNVSKADKNCTVNGRACTLLEYLYYLAMLLINAIM